MDSTHIRNKVAAVVVAAAVVARHSRDEQEDNMKDGIDLAGRMLDSQWNRVVAVPCSHIAVADGSVPKRHLVAVDNRMQPQRLRQQWKTMRYLWDRAVPSCCRVVADDTKDIDIHTEVVVVDTTHTWTMTVLRKALVVTVDGTWMLPPQQHPEMKDAAQANIVVADLASGDETNLAHLLFWANNSANTKTKQQKLAEREDNTVNSTEQEVAVDDVPLHTVAPLVEGRPLPFEHNAAASWGEVDIAVLAAAWKRYYFLLLLDIAAAAVHARPRCPVCFPTATIYLDSSMQTRLTAAAQLTFDEG